MAEHLKILVTNDDGIHSEGIIVLAKVLRELGDVVVIAPDREKSAVAHSVTLHRPLRVDRIKRNYYAVDGTPADCVHLGIHGILPERPHLVVSGINKGGNLGDDITYSGTVSAALEGSLLGVPSIAVSLVARSHFKFGTAARFALKVARHVIRKGLSKDTFLNINVPNLDEKEVKSYRITRQGRWLHGGSGIVEKTDPRGRKYYWVGEAPLVSEKGEDTDIEAVSNSYISITPLHIDLTHHPSIQKLKRWRL